jgi:hypothetical protein
MIILECVAEKKKLRIKFHSFVDDENKDDIKIFTNVYDNSYNCQFPKDIREEGRFYSIPNEDMTLNDDGIKMPFYKVRKNNIKILTEEETAIYKNTEITRKERVKASHEIDISQLKIYEAIECVVCLSVESNTIFIPCAHRCVCNECYEGIKSTKNDCPLCRTKIKKIINNKIIKL